MTTQHRKPDPVVDPADLEPADNRVYLEEHSLVESVPDPAADFGDETQRNEALTTEKGLQQDHFVDTDEENAV